MRVEIPPRLLAPPRYEPGATERANVATNLDVDIAAIERLMEIGNFRSKREAVDAAVREALEYRQQLRSLNLLGTIDLRPSIETDFSHGG